jgi:putative transferase (TIGR04331 family)
MFLATTALSEFWDAGADKTLFLGRWCLRYDHQEDWSRLDYEVLPHPWDDREAMHEAAAYEEEIYENLLGALTKFLNEAHEENRSERYWRIILGPWLFRSCMKDIFA